MGVQLEIYQVDYFALPILFKKTLARTSPEYYNEIMMLPLFTNITLLTTLSQNTKLIHTSTDSTLLVLIFTAYRQA